MKKCPQCQRTYPDENIFCFDDGTALKFFGQTAERSLSGDMPTVVIPAPPFSTSSPAQAQKPHNWLYPIIGVLAALVIILGFLVLYKFTASERRSDDIAVKQEVKDKEAERQAPSPAPSAILAAPITPTPSLPVATEPVKAAPVYAPPVTRVRFGKGKIAGNVSGLLPPGANRSAVLACRASQFLTASINTPDRCVSFTDSSAYTEMYTSAGDNFIYFKNNCAKDASFSMTVTVR